jgi:hypothetical protein
MRKLEEYLQKEILTNRQNQANYELNAENDFAARGRQGPVKLTASQEAAIKNFKTSEEGLMVKITKIREQIAEQEQLIKAA